jgi:hypothetical protein
MLRIIGVCVVCVLENISHRSLQSGWLLCEDHTALQQERSYLVDDRCAPGNKPVTNPVDRLQVKLVIRLDRDETHVLALDSLGNSLRVNEVVLVGLHKRLHELCGDQPHIMALLLQGSTEEMRSGTGFEADQRSLHVRRKCQ